MRAIDYEEVEVTSGAAVGLTAAKINAIANQADAYARIKVVTNTVAFLETGTAPTAATKQTLIAGEQHLLTTVALMRNFKAIAPGATGYLCVTYYA